VADRTPTELTLAEAGALIRARSLSPVELAEAVLARIDRLDSRVNAFTTLSPTMLAEARVAEREIARGQYRGPLHGIPIGVKDLIDTAGMRTTYGSGMFADHVPERDGSVPERLRAAGAVITGKTATHEFGKGVTTNNYFFGPTRNPWNLDHVPGGSSGGAGAAVAAGFGPVQIGTDGGGSIRFPAAFCGVVGFKPTLGLISNRGQFGNGNSSYSVPGPLARTVHDAAITAQVLAGFDPEYIYSRPGPAPDLTGSLDAGVAGLRVGISPDLLDPAPEPAVRTAFDRTVERLAGMGAHVIELRMPNHDLVLPGVGTLFGVEGEVLLEALLGDRPRLFSPAVERSRAQGIPTDPAVWVRAQQDRQRIRRDYAAAFAEADVLIAPVAPFPAPRIDADEIAIALACVPYTGAANLAGIPAVAIPAGFAEGLPLSVQILAPAGGDALALRVARALEQAAPEHRVAMPPL
jgi:aspartyl-tRNA(Asn)/glutamyl-tRNA(Gln) amidotransferase subunit A